MEYRKKGFRIFLKPFYTSNRRLISLSVKMGYSGRQQIVGI
jgi:hypothetical protein